MVRRKQEEKISWVGYSGDGDDLNKAVEMDACDDFMMMLTVIDQANVDKLNKVANHQEIYLKIPLAQAIWSSFRLGRRVASLKHMRLLCNRPPLPDSWHDYRIRFARFRGSMANEDYASEFLKFALYAGHANQEISHLIFGIFSKEEFLARTRSIHKGHRVDSY